MTTFLHFLDSFNHRLKFTNFGSYFETTKHITNNETHHPHPSRRIIR